MTAFTPDELLQLRWLVFDAPCTLDPVLKSALLQKLDMMIAEDWQRLIVHDAACLKH